MSNDPETAKAAIVVGVGSRGRDTARLLAATTRDNTQHCTICGLDTYESQLEAAKQRELELRAVIEKQHAWMMKYSEHDYRCAIFDLNDEGQHYCCTCGLDKLVNIEPSQALREHEAEILEWAAGELAGERDCNCVMELDRMAEERRKK